MQRSLIACLALATCLAACLEVEEQLEVRPDGSLTAVLAAKGDAEDLASGHPLPTHGAWRASDGATLAWLQGAPPPQDAWLRVSAQLASVEDLPTWFAPPTDPFRTAGLERRTTLRIERKGARTVYVFERVLPRREDLARDPSRRIDAALPAATQQALADGVRLSPEALDEAFAIVREAYAASARALARGVVAAVYVEGDGGLAVDALERCVARVEAAVAGAVDEPLLRRLYEALLAAHDDPEAELPPELDLDRVARAAVRAALPAALAAEGLAEPVRNAVLERLEWTFTSIDQTRDVGDETLRLSLRLPGRLVDGNWDALDDGRARWEVQGKDLTDRDVVLRAVSVLE